MCIGAVQRYSESRRRTWRESSMDSEVKRKVSQQANRRRIRSRQQRVKFNVTL